MKKTRKTIMFMLGILTAGTLTLSAQNFQGIATYQSVRKTGRISEGANISPEILKQAQENLKRMGQKEYELKFNLTESTWAEVESLEPITTSESVNGVGVSSFGRGIKYKNNENFLYINQSEVFGKLFLVKDTLKNYEWELTNDTKKIGGYNAKKAILTEIVQRRVISFNNTENQEVTRTDSVKMEAWFTPEIPVSQGPDEFWGLPGLIMEMSDGKTTYLCTKIVLNPQEGVKIQKPSKGKKVTSEELKAIIDQKSKEMLEQFLQGGGSKVKIGGD